MSRPLPMLLSVALLSVAATVHAATPASGDLTDTSGPLTFTGGPFVAPNVSSLTFQARGVLVCDAMSAQATLCDIYTLNVSVSDKFRKDDKNKKEIVQFVINYAAPAAPTGAQVDFDMFIFDAGGAEVARGVSDGGVPEIISLPLSVLKDGSYAVKIIPVVPLGASISGDIHIGKGKKSGEISAEGKDGSGLLLGAFGIPALFLFFGLALLRQTKN